MRSFFIPIYKTSVLVSGDYDVFNRWKMKKGGQLIDKLAVGHTVWFMDEGKGGIYLPKDATDGTIAHECYHAAAYILESRGVAHGPDHHEALAYLLGFLVDEVSRIRKSKRCRKSF